MLSDILAPNKIDARNHLKISLESELKRSIPKEVENRFPRFSIKVVISLLFLMVLVILGFLIKYNLQIQKSKRKWAKDWSTDEADKTDKIV
jgi:hypothetical protein